MKKVNSIVIPKHRLSQEVFAAFDAGKGRLIAMDNCGNLWSAISEDQKVFKMDRVATATEADQIMKEQATAVEKFKEWDKASSALNKLFEEVCSAKEKLAALESDKGVAESTVKTVGRGMEELLTETREGFRVTHTEEHIMVGCYKIPVDHAKKLHKLMKRARARLNRK